jgi:hypothetical protein
LVQQEKEAEALLAKEKGFIDEQPLKSEGMNYSAPQQTIEQSATYNQQTISAEQQHA